MGRSCWKLHPCTPRHSLQWCRAFLSARSHKRLRGFLKNPLLLFPKRPVSEELKSQTEIALTLCWGIGNTQYMHYTVAGAAPMPGAWGFGEYLLYFSYKREEGMTFCEQSPVSFFFFFLSDFSCKYIITVSAFNTYTVSKAAQKCSYCMC